MALHSKNKGKRFEREIAQVLTESGYESRRGIQFRGGEDSPDVISTLPLHIECKHQERLNLNDAIRQSEKDANGKPACVIHKKNRGEVYITTRLSTFLDLIKPPPSP